MTIITTSIPCHNTHCLVKVLSFTQNGVVCGLPLTVTLMSCQILSPSPCSFAILSCFKSQNRNEIETTICIPHFRTSVGHIQIGCRELEPVNRLVVLCDTRSHLVCDILCEKQQSSEKSAEHLNQSLLSPHADVQTFPWVLCEKKH